MTRTSTIVKRFRISYGHILPNHLGKCRNLHGHNALIEVGIDSSIIIDDGMPSEGMVMDFGDVKKVVSKILDTWDHHFLAKGDEWPCSAAGLLDWWTVNKDLQPWPTEIVEQMKMFALDTEYARQIVKIDYRTTAENLSRLLYLKLVLALEDISLNINDDVFVKFVRWWETDDSYAEYTVDDLLNDSLEDYDDRERVSLAISVAFDEGRIGNDAAG